MQLALVVRYQIVLTPVGEGQVVMHDALSSGT